MDLSNIKRFIDRNLIGSMFEEVIMDKPEKWWWEVVAEYFTHE